MQQFALASFLTLGMSLTGAGVLSGISQRINKTSLMRVLDQSIRGLMLAFAIYHIGHELLEEFSLPMLCALTGAFFGIQKLISWIYSQSQTPLLQERYPWLIYTLMFPHFITEGFAIAPHASKNPMGIVVAGFLLHKTIEVAMLTASTNHQIHCRAQRIVLQALFVTLTPISILLYSQYHNFIQISHVLVHITEFLNFIVFLQLAMFCEFCKHNQEKSWLERNYGVILTFATLSIAVYINPHLFGSCSC